MFKIIYLPSGTTVSEYTTKEDAQQVLETVETNPPSHEIIEVTDGNN